MDNYKVQSVLVKKKYYSLENAMEWVLQHGYKVKKVDETKKFYRFRQITPKTLKKNGYTEFRTIKLDKSVDLVIAYHHLSGGFSMSSLNPFKIKTPSLYDIAKITPALIYGRKELPPDVNKVLEKDGDAIIQNITLFRTPLSKGLTFALNVSSLGEFNKRVEQSPYEDFFHLGMLINTNKGVFTCEKEAVVKLFKGNKVSSNKKAEYDEVSLNGRVITLNEFIENGIKQAGMKDFIGYSAKNNNCQKYVMYLLDGNELGNQENRVFVKQDVNILFEGMDWYRKLTNTITGLGEKIDIIQQGAGRRRLQRGGMIEVVVGFLSALLYQLVLERLKQKAIEIAREFLIQNGLDLDNYERRVQEQLIRAVEVARTQILNGIQDLTQIRIPEDIQRDYEEVEDIYPLLEAPPNTPNIDYDMVEQNEYGYGRKIRRQRKPRMDEVHKYLAGLRGGIIQYQTKKKFYTDYLGRPFDEKGKMLSAKDIKEHPERYANAGFKQF